MRVIEIETDPVRVFSPDCKLIQKVIIYVDQETISIEQEEKIIEFFKNL